jgi:hypothetical protein
MSSPSDGFSSCLPLTWGSCHYKIEKKAVSIIEAAHGFENSDITFLSDYGQTSPPFMFFRHQHQNPKCPLPMKTPITRMVAF